MHKPALNRPLSNLPPSPPVFAAGVIRLPSTRHHTVAVVAAGWRTLTAGSGASVLVACSGGADSSALAIAFAALTRDVVIAHVLHDLRPVAECEADCAATAALAAGLGLPFASARVAIAALPGNAEANARRARYAALRELAVRSGCSFVATAHHSADQLETLIMRLIRGSGPGGLRGIVARRPLGASPFPQVDYSVSAEGSRAGPARQPLALSAPITLIRPMLRVSPEAARDLCRESGWTWQEDATNADTTRTRAALRATVLPPLLKIAPRAAERAVESAAMFANLERMLAAAAAPAWATRRTTRRGGAVACITFEGAALATLAPPVIEHLLRRAHRVLVGAAHVKLTRRHTRIVATRIRRGGGGSASFAWPGATLELVQTSPPRAVTVTLRREEVPRHTRRAGSGTNTPRIDSGPLFP
ncbi:MAG: tRNA lysidine(34) synthetase TilS [Phycisphaerales bacterium]